VNLRDYDGEPSSCAKKRSGSLQPCEASEPPAVAALWLSLRQWFTGTAPEERGTALRLQGA
jgi:hypothetical protein